MSQHMEALQRGNEIRLGRAELKREVRAGERTVVEVLAPENPIPRCAESMTIAELLQAQRRWGPGRSRKLLRRLELRETRELRDLTCRQRTKLVEALAQKSSPEPVAV